MASRNIADQLRVELATVERSYHSLVEKNSDLLAGLIHKQEEIVNSTLGLSARVQAVPTSPEAAGEKPLRRPNWNRIRLDYEAKKRNEFWETRIKEVEEADKQKSVQTEVKDVSS